MKVCLLQGAGPIGRGGGHKLEVANESYVIGSWRGLHYRFYIPSF